MAKNKVIVLEQRLVKSRAWLSLTGASQSVYCIFRTKCKIAKKYQHPKKDGCLLDRILNNGELVFTYDEAEEKYGIKRGRFGRTIDQLIDRGFIDIAATGMGVCRVETWYAISDRWEDYGTEKFKHVKRPKPQIANPGFKKRNDFWKKTNRRLNKIESSAKNRHGAVSKNKHGEVLAVRTNRPGEKVRILYKFIDGKWFECKIA